MKTIARPSPVTRRSGSRHYPRLLPLAVGLALASGPALAQTVPAAEPKAEEGKPEKITVTAQRREQELQTVPLPVSTFSTRDLETRGITSMRAIADYTPNMIGQNNTGLGTANVYFMRALGNTESIATFDPPVGTYVNDVYVSRQNANNFSFFDVERIEVLRGPQGTLFGRNTTGGAINVILRKPGDRLKGFVEAGVGRFGATSLRGSVDAPISPSVRTKFTYFQNMDDGYVNNVTTGERLNAADARGGRAALWWNLGGGISWDLALDEIRDKGLNLYNAEVNGERQSTTGYRTDLSGFPTATGTPLVAGIKNSFGLGNHVVNRSVTSTLNVPLDNLSLEFITGWRELSQRFGIDFLQNPAPTGGFTIVNDGKHKQFTQEIKATGDLSGGKLTYVAGAFFLDEENTTDFADILRAGPATLVLGDRAMANDTKSTAFYAQFDYKVTPSTTLTVGARQTKDEKSISFVDFRPLTAGNATTRLSNDNIRTAGNPLSQDTRYTTPRFALAYQAHADLMLFASATRGYKAGGWSSRATTAAAMQSFDPELVWSYEAGWRATFGGGKFRINGTAFSMDVEKLQTVSGVTQPNGSVIFLQKNFTDLKNQGLELELSAAPFPGLTTYLNVGLQDAKYENLAAEVIAQQGRCRSQIASGATARPDCNNGIVMADGGVGIPVRAPKKTVNPGASYVIPLGTTGLRLSTTVNVAYTSRMAASTNNALFTAGHSVVNAGVTLLGRDNRWRLTADCTNCSDKTWFTAQLAGLNYLNEPRRWSVRLHHSF